MLVWTGGGCGGCCLRAGGGPKGAVNDIPGGGPVGAEIWVGAGAEAGASKGPCWCVGGGGFGEGLGEIPGVDFRDCSIAL